MTARTLPILLPPRIDRSDAREAIARVQRTLRDNPTTHFAVAAVGVDRGTCDVDAVGCDFSALHWVALGDACLEWAAKRLAAAGELDLLRSVQAARAALDLEEMKHDA